MRAPASSLKGAALLSSAGVFGAALLWLLSFKLVAFWWGPEGVGLFSQLRQMAQAATIGATFGGANSVVQGLAERQEESARRQFRATASRMVGLSGAAMAALVFVSAPQSALFFLSSSAPDLVQAVRWIALAVLLQVGGTYAAAVLNGYRSFAALALAQVLGPACLVAVLAGAWWWRLSPDPRLLAWAFVLCFGVSCLVGAVGVSRIARSPDTAAPGALPSAQRAVFVRFAVSNLVAALSSTLALLLIRSWVIGSQGLAFAGLFDAAWTMTFNYTTLFLTACSVVYLPQLTAALRPESQKACMLRTAYLVLGASILICHAMVLLKEPLINLLYSPRFQASGEALVVLVVAVMCRGVSWVYGTMILASRDARVLLVSELALNLLLLAATRLSLDQHASLRSLGWAFVAPNFLYLVFVVEYACRKNRLMRRRQIWPLLLAGTLPLGYLALPPFDALAAYAMPLGGLCLAIGLSASAAAVRAYRRVSD